MTGYLQYAAIVAGFLAQTAVVVCVCTRTNVKRYLPLGFYMLCSAVETAGVYWCGRSFGLNSEIYHYVYYYSDSVVMLTMFWVIIRFYLQVFEEMGANRYIRGAATFLLGCTAVFSYAVVQENSNHLTEQFVIEFTQNLYFVGVVLIYLLWGAILKLRETRSRLAQFVLSVGIYFSVTAATYALRNLFPSLDGNAVLLWAPTVVGTWLPFAWVYTFIRVPESSHVVPALLEAKAAA